MATKKNTNQNQNNQSQKFLLFGPRNYKFMFIGLFLIGIGFILMSGGGSDDPKVWNEAIFNFRRIRLAPMIILLGLLVEIYAIMTKPQ